MMLDYPLRGAARTGRPGEKRNASECVVSGRKSRLLRRDEESELPMLSDPEKSRGLDHNPLDFVERNLIPGPIIKLRRPRRLVVGHCLGLFKGASVLKVDSDSGGSEAVTTDM